MSAEREDLLLAYVYDELGPDDKASFEARLSGDAELRAEVDGLVATKSFLDEDMAFGQQSGLDVPPPHLAEAIFRAEALARPPELRDAVVEHGQISRAGPKAKWGPKLMTWLLGGSVAIGGAAAAVMFVVAGADEPSAAPSMVASEVEEAPAAKAGASADRGPKMDEGAEDNLAGDGLFAAKRAARQEPLADPAEPSDKNLDRALDQKKGKKAFAPDVAPQEQGYAEGLNQNAHGRAYPSAPEPQNAPLDEAVQLESAAFEPNKIPVKAAPSKSANAYERDDLDAPAVVTGEDDGEATTARLADMDNFTRSGSSISLGKEQQRTDLEGRKQAPQRTAKAEKKAERVETKANKPATKSKKKSKKRKRSYPKASGFGSAPKSVASGPAPLSEAESRYLAGGRSKKDAPASAALKDEAAMRKVQAQRDGFEAEITLANGNRAFRQGRYKESVRYYQQARDQDRRDKRLGLLPVIGQVRALHKLNRHQEALRLFATVQRGGISDVSADAYLAAAQSAEAIGDYGRAESLYRALSGVKSKAQLAKNALARVQRKRAVNFSADDVGAESAAEEAEAPAKAAPAAKE